MDVPCLDEKRERERERERDKSVACLRTLVINDCGWSRWASKFVVDTASSQKVSNGGYEWLGSATSLLHWAFSKSLLWTRKRSSAAHPALLLVRLVG